MSEDKGGAGNSDDMSLLTAAPWTCSNFGEVSEIEVFVERTKTWETIAEIRSIEGIVDAEDVAAFIVSGIGRAREIRGALGRALVALRSLAAGKGVGREARQAARRAIGDIEKFMF
ncbi:MAG: hypothetical protein PHE27_03470 [Alphaproteobacteria bacterium]|nr:hypothetical protein [Alphaproteobacteria bacterium]